MTNCWPTIKSSFQLYNMLCVAPIQSPHRSARVAPPGSKAGTILFIATGYLNSLRECYSKNFSSLVSFPNSLIPSIIIRIRLPLSLLKKGMLIRLLFAFNNKNGFQ